MPKRSKKQIKKDEQKVIRELQINSNESIDKIAKKCNFSRQKIWRIIKRLEKDYSIWGYAAIIDEGRQGLTNYMLLIKRTNKPIDEKIADKIISRKFEEIASSIDVKIETSLYCHGEYDWIVSFSADNIIKAKKFIELFNNMYHEYVAEIKLLETLFFVRKQGILNPEVEKLKQFL